MTTTLEVLGIAALAAVMGTALVLVGKHDLNKKEIVDCKQWSTEATQYTGYYILQWQKDQCDSHGITINTEVK